MDELMKGHDEWRASIIAMAMLLLAGCRLGAALLPMKRIMDPCLNHCKRILGLIPWHHVTRILQSKGVASAHVAFSLNPFKSHL